MQSTILAGTLENKSLQKKGDIINQALLYLKKAADDDNCEAQFKYGNRCQISVNLRLIYPKLLNSFLKKKKKKKNECLKRLTFSASTTKDVKSIFRDFY